MLSVFSLVIFVAGLVTSLGFCKVFFFLGSVFDIHFFVRAFVFAVQPCFLFFVGFLLIFSVYFSAPGCVVWKNYLHVRSCFLGSFSSL